MLERALSLVSMGFRIFPLQPGKKQPAIKDCLVLSTLDIEQLRKWYKSRKYNIGIYTGEWRNHALIVIDVDTKNNKKGVPGNCFPF